LRAPRRNRHRVGVVLLALTLFGAACSGDDSEGDDGGLSAEPFHLDVRPGECFDRPESPDVTAVPALPCREPHDLEAYAAFELDEGPYPGQSPVAQAAGAECEERFEEYVGAPPRSSGLLIVPFTPDRQAWEADDRRVVCAVTLNEGQLEGSVEGTEGASG
jgi:Septum formation